MIPQGPYLIARRLCLSFSFTNVRRKSLMLVKILPYPQLLLKKIWRPIKLTNGVHAIKLRGVDELLKLFDRFYVRAMGCVWEGGIQEINTVVRLVDRIYKKVSV